MRIEKRLENVLELLSNAGFDVNLVGGCVRDYFIGNEPDDYDISTSARPEEVVSLFESRGYRVIKTGLKHGTVTVMSGGEGFEITTYRVDGDYHDGRHPDEVKFGTSLSEDMNRRDFTMNAIAYNYKTGEFIDEHDGISDIKNRLVKTVGDPCKRFNEDALRMMRAIRFSAQLGFKIDPNTYNAIKTQNELIRLISGERIQAEICKILASNHPEKIDLLMNTGILKIVIPELDVLNRTEQNNSAHTKNVWGHTLDVMKNARMLNANQEVMLASLCHDIGKPKVKTTDENGIDHFYEHERKSSFVTQDVLKRLHFSNVTKNYVSKLVSLHGVEFGKGIKKFKKMILKENMHPNEFKDLITLMKADRMAHNCNNIKKEVLRLEDDLKEFYEVYYSRPTNLKGLSIDGNDMKSLGLQGEDIKNTLNYLLNLTFDNPEHNNPHKLIQFASKYNNL